MDALTSRGPQLQQQWQIRNAKGLMDRLGRSALHYAAQDDAIDRVGELIRQGSDINRADLDGFTPLHMTAQHYSREAAKLLLEASATVDAENVSGNTPLFVATFNSNGRGELIALLLENGAE